MARRACTGQEPGAALQHNAPLQTLDADATRRSLPFDRLIEALRAKFIESCEAPLRHTHVIGAGSDARASAVTAANGTAAAASPTVTETAQAGTLLLMPAWQAGRFLGIKMVSIFPGNALEDVAAAELAHAQLSAQ